MYFAPLMQTLSFQYPYLLAGLVLLPLMAIIFVLVRESKKKKLERVGDPVLVQQLMRGFKKYSATKKFILFSLATGLLVVAVANLRTPQGKNNMTRSGVEVMIALDVSKSMLAQDIQPNRLERAKQLLSSLIDKISNDKVGIVIFAGKAYLQMPLSGDHAASKMYLGAASPGSIPTQGTVIGDALRMSMASFAEKEKKYKAIVLVTDGEDHDEDAIKTAKQLAGEGVVIYTVGIGSADGAPIPDEETGALKTDAQGNTVISKLNEEELMKIAEAGNGGYARYSNSESTANAIANAISTMDQKKINDDSLINYKSLFQYFVGAAFLLLLLELFVSEKKQNRRTLPKIALLLSFLFVGQNTFAQNEKAFIKEGNKAFEIKDFKKATEAYREALTKAPENQTAQYNLGNALYKAGQKDEAVAAYDKAIAQGKQAAEVSNAYYNKGVVLQNDKKVEDCIKAYKQALRLTPNDEDARLNLQKALKQQQENKEKNKDKDKDKKDKNEDKDKDQKDKDDKNKQDEKPKPQPSKLTQKEAEDKLKALMQQEKNLQDKLHKRKAASPNQPEKDW